MVIQFIYKVNGNAALRFIASDYCTMYGVSTKAPDLKNATTNILVKVDTSTAHVAGAIGTPVWVMSRFSSCWRWLMKREDSPWYPTMRVYRQAYPGDWAELVGRVGAALDQEFF